MGHSVEQTGQDTSPSEKSSSFGHLILVWFLVGSSLWTLGFALVDAAPDAIPLSRMGTGLLFGTIVIVLLWSVGWHPSLPASAGYFVAEAGSNLLLLLGSRLMFSREVFPWMEVGIHVTSIVLAASIVFTNRGRQMRKRVRRRIRSLLDLPSGDY